MSTRAKIASAVASVGVLALGWQVGTANGQATTTSTTTTTGTGAAATGTTTGSGGTTTGSKTTGSSSGSSTTGTTTTTSQAASSTTTQAATSASGLKTGTYTGTTATNRYGSVQVSITVANGAITAVNAAADAADDRSASINSRAIPVLKSETLAAQSANISTVSGATYTSTAYKTSLQSALDQAAA